MGARWWSAIVVLVASCFGETYLAWPLGGAEEVAAQEVVAEG